MKARGTGATLRTVLMACVAALAGSCLIEEESAIQDHFRQMVAVVCERNSACCVGLEETAEECADSHKLFISTAMGLTGAHLDALEAGRLRFNAAQAGRCRRSLAALSCEVWRETAEGGPRPQACDDVFRGLVPDGSACRSRVECASAFCDETRFPAEPVLVEEGICRARAAPGEACRSRLVLDLAPCLRGAICRAEVAQQPGTCELLKAEGETCQEVLGCQGFCDSAAGRCAPACSANNYLPFEK